MQERAKLFNSLTLLMLGLTLLVLSWEIVIAIDPQSRLNPWPPATALPQLVITTRTPTPRSEELPPTWTPTSTPTRLIPHTPTPTSSATPTPRVTGAPYPFSYELSYETPYYSCDWLGMAGLVEDPEGKPLPGYSIHIWGGVDRVANAGDTPLYGESGWEQGLDADAVQVGDEYKVQLHAKAAPHAPVSEQISVAFTGDCAQSLAFIVFTKNH